MLRLMKKSIIALFVLSLIIIVSAFSISASTEFPGSINSVILNDSCDRITISSKLDTELVSSNSDSTVYLFELLPSNKLTDLNSITPLAQKDVSESVSFGIDYTKSMLYSSFVLAMQNEDGTYSPISERKYIQNPEILSSNDKPYPTRATKKGLSAQITSDAQYLGTAHTIISIELDKYMAPYQSDSTLPFTRHGQTFYFYEDKLAALDHKVKVYTEAGINVYFNIVLGKSESDGLNFLYVDSSSSNASLYAINTTTVQSSRFFMAFCEFMAERYSSADTTNGFVPAYILGYEVNTTGTWNYAGDVDFENYVSHYENAYRILYSAVKSTYKNGKVFVSVSNLFTADEGISDFGAKAFLSTFAENMKAHTDTEWALAINPYPSDSANTEFWNDDKATDSLDTPYITMKNLDVLSEFMRLENMTFDAEVRDIIISEFGINGNSLDARNSDCQASAYALAYAIADQNEDIDAFLYYRHVDHPAESAHFGLWSSNAVNPLTPENKKPIYNIFRNADTINNSEGLEMARAFMGDELYEKYLGDYTPKAKRTVIDSIPIMKSDIKAAYKEKVLFDLTLGELCGFYPSDNSSYVELRMINENDPSTALYSLQKPASGLTYSGISRSFENIDLSKADYMTLSFKPITPTDQTLTVMLRLESEDEDMLYSYEGIVQITSNTKSELTFKLSDYIKKADGKADTLKLWYKPSSGVLETGEYGLWLEKVTVHEKTGLSAFMSVFGTVMPVVLIIALITLIVFAYAYKPVRNRIKGIIGKTKSKIIGFLKDKKIISRRHKKKKGAKITPPKNATLQQKQTQTKRQSQDSHSVRIVNGRVLPRQPKQPLGAQKKPQMTDTNSEINNDNTTSDTEQ